MVHKIYLIRQV